MKFLNILFLLFAGIVYGQNNLIVSKEKNAPFSTILEAIKASGKKDVILVKEGVYYENFILPEKRTLKSFSKKYRPEINGSKNGYVVKMASRTKLDGFLITNSGNSSGVHDAGVLIENAKKVVVVNNHITNNNHYGIIIKNSKVEIKNNHISDNQIIGIYIAPKNKALISENVIENNGHAGIDLNKGKNNITLSQNYFTNNSHGILYGSYYDKKISLSISDNTFCNNAFAIMAVEGMHSMFRNTFYGNQNVFWDWSQKKEIALDISNIISNEEVSGCENSKDDIGSLVLQTSITINNEKTIILKTSANKPFDLDAFLKAKDFPDCEKTRIDINKNEIYASCYANGVVEEITIEQPDQLLTTVRFYENGNKRDVHHSRGINIEGLWMGYHKNGILSDSTFYKKGAMYGVSKTFFNNGALRSKRTYHQENSLVGYSQTKDGYWEKFFANGQLQLAYTIKNGQWDGKRISYHKNGNIDKDESYDFGKYDGVFKEYRLDGSLYELRLFKNDKRIGVWKNFTDKGALTLTEEYKDGELIIRTEYFYEDSVLRKTVTYNRSVRSEKFYH